MKKIFALLMTAAFIVYLPAASFAKGLVFGASFMTMESSYFAVLDHTIRAVLNANGDTLITLDPKRDKDKQNAQIKELIKMGVDAIFLAPVNSWGAVDGLIACKNAGVPVINLDSPVYYEGLVDCIICSDNLNAGRLCAEDLLKRTDGGKVVIIGNPGTKTGLDRVTKFVEVITENPHFTLVADLDCKGNAKLTSTLTKEIIREVPDIAAMMCSSDTIAMNVIEALREVGVKRRLLIYGVNGSPYAKEAIKKGYMAGTAAQSPISMGHISVETAYQLMDGKKPDKHISVPVIFITAKNVDDFFRDGWQ